MSNPSPHVDRNKLYAAMSKTASNEAIAEKFNLPIRTVAAYRANFTRRKVTPVTAPPVRSRVARRPSGPKSRTVSCNDIPRGEIRVPKNSRVTSDPRKDYLVIRWNPPKS